MHRAGAACQEDWMSLGTGQVGSSGEEHPQDTGEDATRGQEQNRPKGTGRCKATKKEARGWAPFAPTGMQSGAYRTKGGKRWKYSRSVKYQVKLAKYQVKLGQGQKERDSGAKGAQIHK